MVKKKKKTALVNEIKQSRTICQNLKSPTADNDINLARRAVNLLNSMYRQDPKAVECLIELRVPVNEALANHETCQSLFTPNGFSVGLLGVLNGLCGVTPSGSGYIMAILEETQDGPRLKGFAVSEEAYD